jgi:two-component system chemotaxis response regulator CheB
VHEKICVLVVDDSMVFRRVVTDILAAEEDLDVQPPAASGALALARLETTPVDVIVLDVEMPEMSGLEFLEKMRARRPAPIVIMFSSATQRAAATTLDALSLGASDYVAKPSGMGSAAASIELVRAQLLPKIRALGRRPQARASATTGARSMRPTGRASPPTGDGPQALAAAPSRRDEVAATHGLPAPRIEPSSPRDVLNDALVPQRHTWEGGPPPSTSLANQTRRALSATTPELVAIGASTGGPNALAAVLRQLPASFPVPLVIVQHMPPVFTKLLADRLTATTPIAVDEAVDGHMLIPGRGYLAPGDHHMVVRRQGLHLALSLNQSPPEHSCRPAVDVLFRSIAACSVPTLAVVLTGMGQDGLSGCHALKAVGAQILAQDEASSVVWGMPGFVVRAGIADAVVPLDEMPAEIMRRLHPNAVSGRGTSWR